MYKSPIELITKQMNAQIEDYTFNTIQEVAVNIDKEELIRALAYDRDQYKKGYQDGLNAATKHSKWEISYDGYYPYCLKCGYRPDRDKLTDFCPKCGSRMDGEGCKDEMSI